MGPGRSSFMHLIIIRICSKSDGRRCWCLSMGQTDRRTFGRFMAFTAHCASSLPADRVITWTDLGSGNHKSNERRVAGACALHAVIQTFGEERTAVLARLHCSRIYTCIQVTDCSNRMLKELVLFRYHLRVIATKIIPRFGTTNDDRRHRVSVSVRLLASPSFGHYVQTWRHP